MFCTLMLQKTSQKVPYVLLEKAAVLTVNYEIFWRQMAECQCLKGEQFPFQLADRIKLSNVLGDMGAVILQCNVKNMVFLNMIAEKKLAKNMNFFAMVNKESIGFFLTFGKLNEVNGLLESWPRTWEVILRQYQVPEIAKYSLECAEYMHVLYKKTKLCTSKK